MKKNMALVFLLLATAVLNAASGTIPSLTLDRVKFDGNIYDVAGPVTITGISGSTYRLQACGITNLTVKGEGTVIVNGGSISGPIVIEGSPSVTIRGNCIISATDGIKAAVDGTGMTGGSFTLSDAVISSPGGVTIDFNGSGVSTVSVGNGYSLGTSGSAKLKELNLSDCGSMTVFTLGSSVHVSELDLSGCTGIAETLRSGSVWNNWKVSALDISGMRLQGNVSISNQNLTSLDISGNASPGISRLTVTGSTSSLRTVAARNCNIRTANITMAAGSSDSSLDLSLNGLAGNTVPQWGIGDVSSVETTSSPVSQSRPSSASEGSVYYTYSNISGPNTRYVTCPTCGGDGQVNEQTHPGDEITLQFSSQEERDEYVASHPGASSGGHVTGSSGGVSYEYWNANTGEYGPSETTSDPCPTCMTDDYTPKYERAGQVPERYWTSTRTTHVYSSDFGLVINGNAIHTHYDGGMNSNSNRTVDFSSEWTGVNATVNLKENSIEYKAGFAHNTNYGSWTIRFMVPGSTRPVTGNFIYVNAKDYVEDKYFFGINGQPDWDAWLKVNGTKLMSIDKETVTERTFSAGDVNSSIGGRPQQYVIELYKSVSTGDRDSGDNDDAMKGHDITVWPFD